MDTEKVILLVYTFQMVATLVALVYGYKVRRLIGCTRTLNFLIAFIIALMVRHALGMLAMADGQLLEWLDYESVWYLYSHYVIVLPLMSVLFTGFLMSLYYDLRTYLNNIYRKPPTP